MLIGDITHSSGAITIDINKTRFYPKDTIKHKHISNIKMSNNSVTETTGVNSAHKVVIICIGVVIVVLLLDFVVNLTIRMTGRNIPTNSKSSVSDINNYSNRYDIVLLKSLNTSVSMVELDFTNTASIPARRPRRSLPAFANRYIDV